MKKWGMLSVEVGFQILFAKSIEISSLAILKWNFFSSYDYFIKEFKKNSGCQMAESDFLR